MESLYKYLDQQGPPIVDLKFEDDECDVEVSGPIHFESQVETKPFKLRDEPLLSWLKDQSSDSDSEQHAPSLKMAWISTAEGSWQCHIKKGIYDLVLQNFGIEKACNLAFTASSSIARFKGDSEEEDGVSSYHLLIGDVAMIAWSYNLNTHLTQGMVMSDQWLVEDMQTLLQHQKNLIGHPMAVMYYSAVVLGIMIDRSCQRVDVVVGEVEKRTGYHDWGAFGGGIAQGDYSTLSAKMSGSASVLANAKRCAKFLDEMLSFAMENTDLSPAHPHYAQLVQNAKEYRMVLKKRLVVQEIHTEYLLHRTQNQLTAVSSRILYHIYIHP